MTMKGIGDVGAQASPFSEGGPDFISQALICQLEKDCFFSASGLLCLAEG